MHLLEFSLLETEKHTVHHMFAGTRGSLFSASTIFGGRAKELFNSLANCSASSNGFGRDFARAGRCGGL